MRDYFTTAQGFDYPQTVAQDLHGTLDQLNACVECCDRHLGEQAVALYCESQQGVATQYTFEQLFGYGPGELDGQLSPERADGDAVGLPALDGVVGRVREDGDVRAVELRHARVAQQLADRLRLSRLSAPLADVEEGDEGVGLPAAESGPKARDRTRRCVSGDPRKDGRQLVAHPARGVCRFSEEIVASV